MFKTDIKENIELSIIIPTFNRPNYLKQSIDSLINTYKNTNLIKEFIISDSGSDKIYYKKYEELITNFKFIKWIKSDRSLKIEKSIERCVDISLGKYIHIFGDDDIALPGLGEGVESIIKRNENNIIYLNRLIGDKDLIDVNEIAHSDIIGKGIDEISLSKFIENYRHWPGFIPSLIFRRDCWKRGFKKTNNPLEGYSFLEYLFRGNSQKKVYIIGWPLIIQRRGVQTWKEFWPFYFHISMVELLKRMDKELITKNALKNMMQYDLKFLNVISDLLVAKTFPNTYKIGFWKQLINDSKRPTWYKIVSAIIFLIPSKVAILILTFTPYRKKYGK